MYQVSPLRNPLGADMSSKKTKKKQKKTKKTKQIKSELSVLDTHRLVIVWDRNTKKKIETVVIA